MKDAAAASTSLAGRMQILRKRFRAGVLLYEGATIVPFGEQLWAVPVMAMSGGAASA